MEQSVYILIENVYHRNILAIAYTKEQADVLLDFFHKKQYKPWTFIEKYTQHPNGIVVWDGYYSPTHSNNQERRLPLYRSSSEKSLDEHYF